MEWGEIITRGTAVLATAGYLGCVILDAGRFETPRWLIRRRGLWTLGCAALCLHIAAAFHFQHDWSHDTAVAHTAKQTEQVTGWYWGGGIYVNYAFALFWIVDVIFWWQSKNLASAKMLLPPRVTHLLFAFIFLNATVVFGPRYWTYIGIAFLWVVLFVYKRRSARVDDVLR